MSIKFYSFSALRLELQYVTIGESGDGTVKIKWTEEVKAGSLFLLCNFGSGGQLLVLRDVRRAGMLHQRPTCSGPQQESETLAELTNTA